MNSYQISLLALAAAIFGQAIAGGLAFECCLRPGLSRARRLYWFALGSGALLLGLHHGYALELAAKTGIHDLRQAALAGFAAWLYGIAVFGLSRRP